jgi:hypothetical protein
MALGISSTVFAHRYLADGSVEFICLNCLDVVCNVQTEENAVTFLNTHTCESAELKLKQFSFHSIPGTLA